MLASKHAELKTKLATAYNRENPPQARANNVIKQRDKHVKEEEDQVPVKVEVDLTALEEKFAKEAADLLCDEIPQSLHKALLERVGNPEASRPEPEVVVEDIGKRQVPQKVNQAAQKKIA